MAVLMDTGIAFAFIVCAFIEAYTGGTYWFYLLAATYFIAQATWRHYNAYAE